jgi:hypothetical protein
MAGWHGYLWTALRQGSIQERQAPEMNDFYDEPFFGEVLRNGTVGA